VGVAGGAQQLLEGVAVVREGVQRPESKEGVPNIGAPEPGVGGRGCHTRDDREQVVKFRVEYCKKGRQVVSRA
jgi:hypothetical protein